MVTKLVRLGIVAAMSLSATLAFAGVAHAQPCPVPVGTVCPTASPSPSQQPSPSPSASPTKKPSSTPTPSSSKKPSPTPSQQPTRPPPPPPPFPTEQPSEGAGFPPGLFPGGFPTTPTEDIYQPPSDPLDYGEDRTGIPGFGQSEIPEQDLAAAPSTTPDPGPALKILALLTGAGTIAFLLVRARVRRWMIGI